MHDIWRPILERSSLFQAEEDINEDPTCNNRKLKDIMAEVSEQIWV